MLPNRSLMCAFALAVTAAGCEKANPPAVAPDKPSMMPPTEGAAQPGGKKGSDGTAKPVKEQ